MRSAQTLASMSFLLSVSVSVFHRSVPCFSQYHGYMAIWSLCTPDLFDLLGTDHMMTSAYHPYSNGLVLKVVNDHQNNWDELLDPVLFAIRTSRQKSTKYHII